MEFELESKLLDVLRETSERTGLFARRNAELLVFEQVELGQTIPDLVIVRRRPASGGRAVRLTPFESWIVGELMRAGYLREATITRKLFALEPDVQRALRRLERVKLITKTPRGTFTLVSNFSARFEVLSIEAKLTRWRTALEQAKSYLRFSDLAYIALPASIIDRNTDILDACEREGIGVISVGSGEVEIVLPAVADRPDPREWTWLLAKTGALQI